MSQIRNFMFIRHLRSDSNAHVLLYRGGEVRRSGRGLAFWFLPLSASVAEVPVDDRELVLHVVGRAADFQDVTVQGANLLSLREVVNHLFPGQSFRQRLAAPFFPDMPGNGDALVRMRLPGLGRGRRLFLGLVEQAGMVEVRLLA